MTIKFKQFVEDVNLHTEDLIEEEVELTLEDFTLEELEAFIMSEDFDQLDELSKQTLGNYYTAAKADNKQYAMSRKSGDEDERKWAKDRYVKRSNGMVDAKKRLNKEEKSTYSSFIGWLEEACGSKKMKQEELGCGAKGSKVKVHTGDEDSQKVAEECDIEEAKKDDYWDFKDLKDEPKSTTRKVAGRAYGGAAQKDDDEDETPKPTEKRGRGRPKGTASGARQIGSSGKKSYGGLAIHSLSLPNRNK